MQLRRLQVLSQFIISSSLSQTPSAVSSVSKFAKTFKSFFEDFSALGDSNFPVQILHDVL